METNNQAFFWLDLIDCPAFCVKDCHVVATNYAAVRRMIQTGTHIRDIVTKHQEEYESFDNGCLHLTISAGGIPCGAYVTRTKDYDLFVMRQDDNEAQLQTLALAAQQLRIPLSNVMLVADRLLHTVDITDSASQEQANQINRGLFQLLRIISNMSDAARYQSGLSSPMQNINLTSFFDEIMEKIQVITKDEGITLLYTGIDSPVIGLANAEKLERAVYNLLSNAIKFTPKGAALQVKVTKCGNTLSFAVCNPSSEADESYHFWNRYHREPSIEDTRFGLGLGMTLISSVAASHGGTVLIDHPTPAFTRVTMTIAIQQDNSASLRSPILKIGDYAGGRDKGLLEFSEILSSDSYQNIN